MTACYVPFQFYTLDLQVGNSMFALCWSLFILVYRTNINELPVTVVKRLL